MSLLRYESEWEWGWKSPLLLFPSSDFLSPITHLPLSVRTFLTTPLTELDLSRGEAFLSEKLAHLKTTRIGVKFERIQESLFTAHPDTESVRAGIQIPGITEIDLLHRLHSLPSTVIHWEVAIKFYLALDEGGSTDADRWVGPAGIDTLGKKMRAIRDRQLSVLKNPEIALKIGIPETDTILRLPKVHGILFTPWKSSSPILHGKPDSLPPGVTSDGLRGIWFHESHSGEFLSAARLEFPNARIFILHAHSEWIRSHLKIEWIGTPPGTLEVSRDTTHLKNYFNTRPELSPGSDSPGKEPFQGIILDSGREIRFFCVPDDGRIKL